MHPDHSLVATFANKWAAACADALVDDEPPCPIPSEYARARAFAIMAEYRFRAPYSICFTHRGEVEATCPANGHTLWVTQDGYAARVIHVDDALRATTFLDEYEVG